MRSSTFLKIRLKKLLASKKCMYKKNRHHYSDQNNLIFNAIFNMVNSCCLKSSDCNHKGI